MRRQTLFMIPALVAVLAGSAFMAMQAGRTSRVLQSPGAWRRVEAQGLTVEVPVDASSPVLDPGDPWTATEFKSPSLGQIRIARERPRAELDQVLQKWFELPAPLAGPMTCRIQGQTVLARPVITFGPSGLFHRRQGKWVVAVCVFDLDGSRYWVQTRKLNGTRDTLAGFDRLLLSLQRSDGVGVDPLLKRGLDAAEAELPAGFIMDPAWVPLLPLSLVVIGVGLAFGMARLSGRAPAGSAIALARYQDSGVEVSLGYALQRKYFDVALAVVEDRLVLYTFGTPFLNVPLASLPGKVTEGTAWFGPPYLEFSPEGRLDFQKNRFLYGLWSSRTRLRIYTEDASRLKMALGI